MPPVSWNVINYLWPEIAVLVTAAAVLLFDLAFLRGSDRERRISAAMTVTLAGSAIAILLAFFQFGSPARGFGDMDMLVLTDLVVFVKIIILALVAATACVAAGRCETDHIGEFFALILLAAIGMLFLTMAEELIMIFVALELTSLSLYMLTAFNKSAGASVEGGLKYFIFGAVSSAILYFGMTYLYGLTGETRLAAVAAGLAGNGMDALATGPLAVVAMTFVIVGFGFKVAAVPFHLWAPDAYEGAPTPVTAFLATGSKIASFVILMKVLIYGFGAMEAPPSRTETGCRVGRPSSPSAPPSP